MKYPPTRILLVLIGLLALNMIIGCGCTTLEEKALTAAFEGNHTALKRYLSQGVDPAMTCLCPDSRKLGSTRYLINAAVKSGSWETVKLVTENRTNKDGALYFAIRKENLPLAKQLVAKGARLYKYQSYNCIHSALSIQDLAVGEEMFKFVMGLGADINQPSSSGKTIITTVLADKRFRPEDNSPSARFQRKLYARNTRLVLSQNPDLNQPSPDATALMYASRYRDKTDVAMLLDHGADPNLRNANGETALMMAVGRFSKTELERVETINLLTRYNADLNLADSAGATALMVAAYISGPSTVNRLLSLGADIDARDKNGETALFKAIRGNQMDFGAGSQLNADARCEIIRLLAGRGADLNTQNTAGLSPLALARRLDHPKIASALADLGGRDLRRAAQKSPPPKKGRAPDA